MTNLIRLPASTNMAAQMALDSALVDTESDHLKDVLICGYTEAQMLQFRRDALEEAAEMCELFDATDTKYIATAIRKIKDEK